MIPTLNQSKCLRMLEEWSGGVQELGLRRLVHEDCVHVNWLHALDTGGASDDLTRLVLLAHRDGLAVLVKAVAPDEFLLAVRVPPSDPPSLTKLRRRAHAGRLSAKKGGE